ncbi:hypothetical protein ACFY05_40350 [Microtetraspora fusca]|uniref:Uncharacterized protein n=1 Tax=Microtetraspora fusca TaxID=1997 RepID=A0ABW6VI94_MICFU
MPGPPDADSAEWRYLHESAAKFNAEQDDLVAVPAVENTWYDGTGHINVFNRTAEHSPAPGQQGRGGRLPQLKSGGSAVRPCP